MTNARFGLAHNIEIRNDAKAVLEAKHADCFVKPLSATLTRNLPDFTTPSNTDNLASISIDAILELFIEHKTTHENEFIQTLFNSIRQALDSEKSKLTEEQRDPVDKAAIALYMIAACRAINIIDFEDKIILPEKSNYITRTPPPTYPRPEESSYETRLANHPARTKLICGIISAAIYGGKVVFSYPPSRSRIPDVTGVYEIPPLNAGSDHIGAMESCLYSIVFKDKEDAPKIIQTSAQLPEDLRADLIAELHDLKEIKGHCVAIIIQDHPDAPRTYLHWADKHKIPIMLPSTADTASLLHIPPDTLISQLNKLWDALKATPKPDHTPDDSKSTTSDQVSAKTLESLTQSIRTLIKSEAALKDADKAELIKILKQLETSTQQQASKPNSIWKSVIPKLEGLTKIIKAGTGTAKAIKELCDYLSNFL